MRIVPLAFLLAGISCTTGTFSGLASANAGLTVASGQTLTLTGATVAGAPTWSSSQAITVSTATQASITTMANLTTVGALNAGSITSGFGSIDIGADAITAGAASFTTVTAAGAGSGFTTLAASGTVTVTATGTSIAASGDVSIATTKKLALNAGLTSYLYEQSGGVIRIAVGSTDIVQISSTGINLNFGGAASFINLAPSTASTPHLLLNPGVTMSSGFADGMIWYDGTNLKMRVGAVTKTFTLT